MSVTRRQVLAGSAVSAAALASNFPAPAIAQNEPIKIGYLPALTGPSSSTGVGINRGVFDRAGQAIMAKIMENADAAEALKVTTNPRVSAAAAQVPKGLKDQAAE